jgi:hypothetical protein
MAKVEIKRDVTDISPKTANPSIVLILVTAAQAIISGDWNAPETATAIAAAITAVVSYFSKDKVEETAEVVDEGVVVTEVGL